MLDLRTLCHIPSGAKVPKYVSYCTEEDESHLHYRIMPDVQEG